MRTASICTLTRVQDVTSHTGLVDSQFPGSLRGCGTAFPDSIAFLAGVGGAVSPCDERLLHLNRDTGFFDLGPPGPGVLDHQTAEGPKEHCGPYTACHPPHPVLKFVVKYT